MSKDLLPENIHLRDNVVMPTMPGGKNHISNYQVLCLFCNRVKGCAEINTEELREKVRSIVKNMIQV